MIIIYEKPHKDNLPSNIYKSYEAFLLKNVSFLNRDTLKRHNIAMDNVLL